MAASQGLYQENLDVVEQVLDICSAVATDAGGLSHEISPPTTVDDMKDRHRAAVYSSTVLKLFSLRWGEIVSRGQLRLRSQGTGAIGELPEF